MDDPGSSNQRDRLRRSTSAPPTYPEMKTELERLVSRRVDYVSGWLQKLLSDVCDVNIALEQCLAKESSSAKVLEKCIEDKIDLNTPITECCKMVGQSRTLGKEVNSAVNIRNEEKRMYEDLHEEAQRGTQVVKCLRKTIQELEEEASNSLLLLVEKITEIIEKRKALEEVLRALSLEESDHR